MKKSFKKSIAVLLSVFMMACAIPFSAFADDVKPNVDLQFNAFSAPQANKEFANNYPATLQAAQLATPKQGLVSAPLVYDKNAGTLTLEAATANATKTAQNWSANVTGDHVYGVGDFFTVTVRLDNISKLAAAQVAIGYSSNIEPAGLVHKTNAALGFYSVSDTLPTFVGGSYANYAKPGYPMPSQSAAELYAGLNDGLVGDASYIDSENNVIYTYVSNQNNQPYSDVSSVSTDKNFTNPDGTKGNTFANKAILATYAFKIVGSGAITFSMANASDVDDCYYVADEADGLTPDKYITYAQTDNAGSTGITFMGRNEYVASSNSYTVTFKKQDNTVISSATYAEGASIVVPSLPTKAADATNHYTFAWDVTPASTATEDATYTAIETATPHTFTETIINDATTSSTGLKSLDCEICGYHTTEIIPIKTCTHTNTTTTETVTKEATCSAPGSKTVTVTCNDCGQPISTEVVEIPKTSHNYGAWTYNGDAVYVSGNNTTNGTQSRECSICGNKETEVAPNTGAISRAGTTLTLESSITMNIMVSKSAVDYYDSIYLSCTTGGKTTIIEKKSEYNSAYYKYAFEGIAPQVMGEDVIIQFYGTKNGVQYWGPECRYGVYTYVNNTLGKTSSSASLKRLLVDLMYYGAACQVYANYNKDTLMTELLSEQNKALRSTDALSLTNIKDDNYVVTPGAKVTFNTALRLSNAVELMYLLRASSLDMNNVTIKVDVRNGERVEYYTKAENPEMFGTSSGYNVFYYNGVYANQMSYPVDVTVYENGVAVSNTIRYSIESYAAGRTSGQAIKPVTDAMMHYGISAYKYANK